MFNTIHLHREYNYHAAYDTFIVLFKTCDLRLIEITYFVVMILTFGFAGTCRALASVAANGGDHR
jgi:hypothetical protein